MVEYVKVRLWADRVRMVKRYLGREDYWRERVGRLVEGGGWDGGLDDELAHVKWAGEPKAKREEVRPEGEEGEEGEPWVAAGVSRATWYRRKSAEEKS